MNTDRVHEIEGKALDVLLTVFADENSFNLPMNIPKVVQALGLSLKEGDFKDEEIVGAYDRASKTIYVAKNDNYSRKAFTIAHEVGHFVLHDEKVQEAFFRKNLIFVEKEKVPVEREANLFAASLLMPRGIVLRYFKIIKQPDYLADIFGVSYSAMRLRLKNLGLIEG
jgi:Zn-dependent peptidase ImmA (M78 family)